MSIFYQTLRCYNCLFSSAGRAFSVRPWHPGHGDSHLFCDHRHIQAVQAGDWTLPDASVRMVDRVICQKFLGLNTHFLVFIALAGHGRKDFLSK